MHPQPSRVAEIVYPVSAAADPDFGYASGYRVSSSLVLTAAHGLSQDVPITVRLPVRDEYFNADVIWFGGREHDVALLQLTGLSEEDRVPPVLPGELPSGAGQVEFRTVGFPRFASHGDIRQSSEVEGTIQLASLLKSPGLIALNVATAPPRNADPDWKGISGAAVFTRDDSLLVGVISQIVPAAGNRYAEATRLDAIPDEQFWHLLERRPAEVGTLWQSVIPHRSYVERLTDFERNLTSELLPFIPPREHEAHPSNLYSRLRRMPNRGLLMVGGAGTGKTRTCLEVAERAEDSGWRVFHVMTQVPEPTIQNIGAMVLREESPSLVILDDLNEQIRNLDLAAFRRHILEAADRYGVSVSCLASARPGWLRAATAPVRAELKRIFDEVPVCDEPGYLSDVSHWIVECVASRALDRLGQNLFKICGSRPTIALLIAAEIERRVVEGRGIPDLDRLRAGDLLSWLEVRFAEDGLEALGQDGFQLAKPSPALQASAAAAAACPQPRHDIIEAVRRVAERSPGDELQASSIIDRLIDMRWLEYQGSHVAVAHDVVVDQLLENTLLPDGLGVEFNVAETVLLACMGSARTIGLFAGNLGRLIGDLELEGNDRGLAEYCEKWLLRHAQEVGQVLRYSAYEGSYNLGAILDGSPWAAGIVRAWGEVVKPWLDQFGMEEDARHLFYVALPKFDGAQADYLRCAALQWLSAHNQAPQAMFVISRLLERSDLTPEEAVNTIKHALTWLKFHAEIPPAQFVISGLLKRPELTPGDAATVRNFALAWLGKFHKSREARFVLAELLKRGKFKSNARKEIFNYAFVWLNVNGRSPQAQFVLKPLLARKDLAGGNVIDAVGYAFNWLKGRALNPEMRFVLTPLLRRTDLTPEDASKAVTHALSWLSEYDQRFDADFVLNSLLARLDLTAADSSRVFSHVVTWLQLYGRTEEAEHVLDRLTCREDVGLHELGLLAKFTPERMSKG